MDSGHHDASAYFAYRAACMALSAVFAKEGRVILKDEELEAALERELVISRRVPAQVAEDFAILRRIRRRGEDVPKLPVDTALAYAAIGSAGRILEVLEKLWRAGAS